MGGEHAGCGPFHGPLSCCGHQAGAAAWSSVSRRVFLGTAGAVAFTGAAMAADRASEPEDASFLGAKSLPPGKALRVLPVLVYHIPGRMEKTTWRSYGASITREGIDQDAQRITAELKSLAGRSEFPLDVMKLALASSAEEIAAVAATTCDVLLVYAQGGQQAWLEALGACGKPNVLFVRYHSGPFYFWYETAHWWLLRKQTDAISEPNIGVDDIVVDDYDEVLWRLRSLYGLKNARGTKSIALGGLAPYSEPAAKNGPGTAKDLWGYEIQTVEMKEIERRIVAVRADATAVAMAERQANRFAAQPGVTMQTDPRFLVNTFLALKVVRDILRETGGTNIGVAHCMGPLIAMLDTTPCLLLSLLNDEGITAFCHTDYSHTPPGVLLRWISGKPPFVCNTHFPHAGKMTMAHCAAPRRMNGRDFEPTAVTTHFESDYGAATKVEYPAGQPLTTVMPSVDCTRWQGFKATVLDSPAYDICRSQMNVRIDGDWRRLLREMKGFHAVVVYGDYLREVGYCLGKLKVGWTDYSLPA